MNIVICDYELKNVHAEVCATIYSCLFWKFYGACVQGWGDISFIAWGTISQMSRVSAANEGHLWYRPGAGCTKAG